VFALSLRAGGELAREAYSPCAGSARVAALFTLATGVLFPQRVAE
jgi:hypothetical protein